MSMTRTRRQHRARDSRDMYRMLLALERIADQQAAQMKVIIRQEIDLSALKNQGEMQMQLDRKFSQFEEDCKKKTYLKRKWDNEIFQCDPFSIWHPDDEMSLDDILAPDQLWSTPQFRWAYPKTAKFLEKATAYEKSFSAIYCDTFFSNGEVVGKWTYEKPHAVDKTKRKPMWIKMWNHVKRRTISDEQGGVDRIASQVLGILDISPIVATILLASTPKSVVSSVSPFLERYLSFTNFGKASMQSIKSTTTNIFIFEYHFAFYYVTKQPLESYLAHKDARKLRKFSWFGQREDKETPTRYIYEEQMSFILTGHGQDIYTCYQLGEKYFNGVKPDQLRTFVNSPTWTPSTMFLSWIGMALHHVGIRWENAIAAIEEQIGSEEAVVFHEIENFDLGKGAKDLHISTLRTYFWALEAYKLFEEKLESTVDAWEQFKCNSLDKVNDGRNLDDYERSVELIEAAIDRLREKIERIQKKSRQILRLRDGLFSVTSMSDTTAAIKQGENIKLLTYISILFLPLSFATSVFGMQMIDGRTSMKTFSIVILTITASTILTVSLLIGGVQRMCEGIGRNTRRAICQHSSVLEKKIFEILPEPSRKWRKQRFPKVVARKQSGTHVSLRAYIGLLAELCFVAIPASEVNKALRFCGSRGQQLTGPSQPERPLTLRNICTGTTMVSEDGPDREGLDRKSLAKQVIEAKGDRMKESSKSGVRMVLPKGRNAIFIVIRTLFLFVWVPLLLFEYIVLLFIQSWTELIRACQSSTLQRRDRKQKKVEHFFITPLLSLGIDFPQHHLRERRLSNMENSQKVLSATGTAPLELSPSTPSSQALGNDMLRPNTDPHIHGALQWKNIISQRTFQDYQNQKLSNLSVAATPQSLQTPQPTLQSRQRGYSDVENAYP